MGENHLEDYFPDNDLAQYIAYGDLDEVSYWTFASAFLHLCWRQAGVPWKSAVTAAWRHIRLYFRCFWVPKNLDSAERLEFLASGGHNIDAQRLLFAHGVLEGLLDQHLAGQSCHSSSTPVNAAVSRQEHVLLSQAGETGETGESVEVLSDRRRLIEGLQDLHHESGGLFGNELLVPGEALQRRLLEALN